MSNDFWEDSISENFIEETEEESDASLEDLFEDEEDEQEVDEEEMEELYDLDELLRNKEPVKTAFNLNNKQQSVVNEAMVRLEQARLYEMLIKHNVFEGVDADAVAIEKVKKELKGFLVERLEILLGIRQEKSKVKQSVSIQLPFNEIEVQFLKDLSLKGTKGASAQSQPARAIAQKSPTLEPVRSEIKLNPLPKLAPSTLNKAKNPEPPQEIEQAPSNNKNRSEPLLREEPKEKQPQKKAVKKKIKARQDYSQSRGVSSNVKDKINKDIEKMSGDILRDALRGMSALDRKAMSKSEFESLKERAKKRAVDIFKAARDDLGIMSKRKAIDEMTWEEMQQQNSGVRGQKQVSNKRRQEIPSFETLKAHYQRRGNQEVNMQPDPSSPNNALDGRYQTIYKNAMSQVINNLTAKGN